MDDVPELLEDLGKPDYREREDATDLLVKIGQAAVEPLVAAFGDSRWEVRAGAANALGRIGDTRAVGPLIDLLRDPLVGWKAAIALGLIGDRQAVEPLNGLLSDPYASTRDAAREALDTIAKKFPLDESLQRPRGAPISHRAALRRIIANGIESVLLPAHFEAVSKRTWVRREPELVHLIALGFRHGTYGLEFGIVSPEATDFVWGHPAKAADFGDVVMHGTPDSIHWPAACQYFQVGDQEDSLRIDEIAGLVAQDMATVAGWLGQFQTRRQLRAYLTQNQQPTGGNGFFIPSPALNIFIEAVLAVVDRDPAAVALAEQAEIALRPWSDRFTVEQIRRLKAAVGAMSRARAERE